MRQDIKLFIENQEVDFATPPDIKFTYNRIDYTNPTVIKVGYSKTLQIEGTQNNNRIFNSIWRLDRTQGERQFNPSKRVKFQLFENGDLLEEGYVKLDDVIREGNKIVYDISLFAGLNDFFYSLSFKEDGSEYKLADLQYLDDDNDLDFTITRNVVNEAWNNLGKNEGDTGYKEKWDVINFAPMYNGIPNGLDANKVLIDTLTVKGETRMVSGDTIVTQNGLIRTSGDYSVTNSEYYALGELNDELTEWEMKDLRSWCQRPVYHIPALFRALMKYPEKNCNGYRLVLDDSFFHSSPYYQNAWMTLPMLSGLKLSSSQVPYDWEVGNSSVYNYYYYKYAINNKGILSSLPTKYSLNFDFVWNANATSTIAENTLYLASDILNADNTIKFGIYGAVSLQLLAYDSQDKIVAGSNVQILTNKTKSGKEINIQRFMDYNPWIISEVNSQMNINYGVFTKTNDNYFKWSSPVNLDIDVDGIDYSRIVLSVHFFGNRTDESTFATGNYAQKYLYNSNSILETSWKKYGYLSGDFENTNSTITLNGNGDMAVRTGSYVRKADLLSVDGSVCDWLLSYCKLFNLYFEKDMYSKTIYIKKRDTWYSSYPKAVDISDKVDYGKEMIIKPISFDTKWYQFSYTGDDDSKFGKEYKEKYGVNFGTHKVDTGQEFNKDINDLLKGNKFVNGTQVIEQSKYFKKRMVGTNICPPFLYDWITYKLFDDKFASKEFKVAGGANFVDTHLNSYGTGASGEVEGWYDGFDKLQMRDSSNSLIDKSGCLLFFNEMKDCKNLGYILSDDLAVMGRVNGGQPCWMYTANPAKAIQLTHIPQFSRNYSFGDEVQKTFYFGASKETYIPYLTTQRSAYIFDYFWRDYIEDLYSINTKIVECYLKMDGKVVGDWLKKFYYFDGNYWVLTKITDYSITSFDTVKCEFIKVNNPYNYHNGGVNIPY